jgi:hypothetical protein
MLPCCPFLQGGELYLLRVFHPRSSWRDDVALNQRYHKYADLLNRLRQRRAGGAELAYMCYSRSTFESQRNRWLDGSFVLGRIPYAQQGALKKRLQPVLSEAESYMAMLVRSMCFPCGNSSDRPLGIICGVCGDQYAAACFPDAQMLPVLHRCLHCVLLRHTRPCCKCRCQHSLHFLLVMYTGAGPWGASCSW